MLRLNNNHGDYKTISGKNKFVKTFHLIVYIKRKQNRILLYMRYEQFSLLLFSEQIYNHFIVGTPLFFHKITSHTEISKKNNNELK